MKRIALTQGAFAIVDDRDYHWLKKYKWALDKRTNKQRYAQMNGFLPNGNRSSIRMHQMILGTVGTGMEVDHVDGDGLNNRRNNLRIATRAQNTYNNHRGRFKGITRQQRLIKFPWQARICYQGHQMHLGYFATIKEAAFAYNEAAKRFYGEFACLNKTVMEPRSLKRNAGCRLGVM